MNIRTFLRGGYRSLEEPTTIISGTTPLGTWTPVSRSVQPEGEDASGGASTAGAEPVAAAAQTEAPANGGSAPSAGRGGVPVAPVKAPAGRSVRSVAKILDDANKAGR